MSLSCLARPRTSADFGGGPSCGTVHSGEREGGAIAMISWRKWALVHLSYGCLVRPGVILYAVWPQSGISHQNAAKLQLGMTLEDVERLLGGPERDEGVGPVYEDTGSLRFKTVIPVWLCRGPLWRQPNCTRRVWLNDRLLISVEFDENERVIRHEYRRLLSRGEPFVEKLCRWLGL